jgi:uncharacterized protein (UPF0335 family)|tara:strand:+ start:50 stop:280 length:231 start_codon:yes stop_codon:yes gene_type:complete
MATKETIKELVEKLTTIENEIKLLQVDRKDLLSSYSDRVDVKAFRAAWSVMKAKKRVDESEFEQILDEIEKNSSLL